MPKSEISNFGWRPHAVYEILDINRQTLFYWRDSIYPKANQKFFSTYEILLFLIIKTYNKHYGIQITRLREVDWKSILKVLNKMTFSGFDEKILNIDLRDHTFAIFNSTEDFDSNDGQNSYISIDKLSKDLVNKILNFGS